MEDSSASKSKFPAQTTLVRAPKKVLDDSTTETFQLEQPSFGSKNVGPKSADDSFPVVLFLSQPDI